MIVYIGADHGGFELKETIRKFLKDSGYTVEDMGNIQYDPGDDYVDFAKRVSEKVAADPYNSRGILLCRSGHGVDIVANRFPGIRSALSFSPDHALESRTDDDANVLSLAADFIDPETAKRVVSVWLQTPFSGEERHKRRLKKIEDIGHSIN